MSWPFPRQAILVKRHFDLTTMNVIAPTTNIPTMKTKKAKLALSFAVVMLLFCFGICFISWRGQLVEAGAIHVDYSRLKPFAHPWVDEACRVMLAKKIRVPKEYDLMSGSVHTFFHDSEEGYDYSFRFPHESELGGDLRIRVRLRDELVWVETI